MLLDTTSVKRFRDNIQNYINIPEVIVEKIIDTQLFQRLRSIEQTGMRVLYPSTRHDRFIHSLGVYHLGVIAFDRFRKNAVRRLERDLANGGLQNGECPPDEKWWVKHEILFALSCLLHDVGHAPYSHTLEYIYALQIHTQGAESEQANLEAELINILQEKFERDCTFISQETASGAITSKLNNLPELNWQLIRAVDSLDGEKYNSQRFVKEYFYENGGIVVSHGKAHESLSAIILVSELKDDIKAILESLLKEAFPGEQVEGLDSYDVEFIARAIIGCKYEDPMNLEDSLKNCFISLLNSDLGFDIDGMDYVKRDTVNSGFDNTSVDYERMLNSFTLVRHENVYKLGFAKSGVSVLRSYISARNALYREIYAHHKVVYMASFLRPELIKLASKWYCCKKNMPANKQNHEMCNCLLDEGYECAAGKDNDDYIAAEILGFGEYTGVNETRIGGIPHIAFRRSSDTDLDVLFRQILIEIEAGGYTSPGANAVSKYIESYFSRKHHKAIWKSPEELPFMLNEKPDCYLPLNYSGGKHIVDVLVDEKTKTQQHTKMAELWRNEKYREVFEEHGISWPVCVKYHSGEKELKEDDILIDLGDDQPVTMRELYRRQKQTDPRKDLFYIFGEAKYDLHGAQVKEDGDPFSIIELFDALRSLIEEEFDGNESSQGMITMLRGANN